MGIIDNNIKQLTYCFNYYCLLCCVVVFSFFGIHNPGVGGSSPPIATIQIKHLGENQVLFLCLK